MKDEEIVERKQIITGFSDQHFIIKSATAKYQTVKLLSTDKYSCHHDCLGTSQEKFVPTQLLLLYILTIYINIWKLFKKSPQ